MERGCVEKIINFYETMLSYELKTLSTYIDVDGHKAGNGVVEWDYVMDTQQAIERLHKSIQFWEQCPCEEEGTNESKAL